MNIDNVIKALIAREGGFSNRATDRGGPTKYGITQHTLSLWLAREVDEDDVRNLCKSTAYEIYYSWYYIKPGINQLPPLIQPVMLDMTANHGQKNAIKMLQDAITSHGHACGKIDGKIGDKTIAAASKAEAEMGNDLLRALVNRRKIFMEAIVRNDETQREYLGGWLARAESFLPDNQQQRQEPLSDERIREIFRATFPGGTYLITADTFKLVRAIERAHGIGGEQ